MQAVIDVELEGHAYFLRARVLALANGTLSLTAFLVFLIGRVVEEFGVELFVEQDLLIERFFVLLNEWLLLGLCN